MSGATKILMGSGGVDLPSDDEFNNVSFLSHFDGANNGVNNAFDDGSTGNHTVTAVGNVTQGTFGPFARVDGEWSNYFALGGDALTFTNDATMSWDGDFTIELFCNVGTIATEGSTNPSLLLIGSIQLYLNATSGSPNFVALHVGGADIVESAADSITIGVWHHIAIVRSGSGTNNLSLYLNGTRVDQVTNTATLGGSSGTSRIGNYAANPAGGINGYMSNVRILKGTALYSGSSLTVPTSALTAITNTKLLTCQSNRFIDNSATGFALTVAATPQASAFTPMLTSTVYDSAVNGASAHCDGSGDYITVATSSDFDLGTADFTISAWFYSSNDNTFAVLGDMSNSGTTDSYQIWWNHSAEEFRLGTADLANMVGWAVTLNLNSWNNVVFSRASGAIKFFFNGVEITSRATDSGDLDGATFNAPTPVYIGSFNSADAQLNGYITDVRIIKGTAVNPSGQPTAPLTAVTNTKLLLNMADGQALDSAAQNNITLHGNADTSTTQQKVGTASLYLDGSSWATMQGPAYFTGDFTWEAWVYQTSRHASTWSVIFSQDDYAAGNSISCWITHEGKASIYYEGGGTHFTTSSTFPVNTWTHLAFVREGTGTNEFSIYINGTAGVTGTMATSFDQDGIVIGRKESTPGNYYTGYIDEFRMSSMARYTGNFTPTTAAFPDKGQEP